MLVTVVLAAGLLEVILRDAFLWPGVALVAVVAPAVCLPWRRTHPLRATAVVFGSILLADAVALLGTGQPTEVYAGAYVLLVPYALFRWGSGAQAAAGTAVILASQVVLAVASGNFGDLALGLPFLALAAALGASMRYRASSRLAAADQIRMREREQLARELHDTNAEIADELFISLSTTKTHLASLMMKLGARNRVELAMWAYETDRLRGSSGQAHPA